MDEAGQTTAAALLIGNELLAGKVVDENLPVLARELWQLGISLREVRIVRDEIETIAAAVRALSPRHTYLFTTGGIGPTHDDVTVDAVAYAFGVGLVVDPELERTLRATHPEGQPTASQLRMARIPEGGELVGGGEGVWPTVRVKNIYLFPGIPPYFRERLASLRNILRGSPFTYRDLHTTLGEGQIAEGLREVAERFPEVEIGSYPAVGRSDYRVRVTFAGRDAAAVAAACEAVREKLPAAALVEGSAAPGDAE